MGQWLLPLVTVQRNKEAMHGHGPVRGRMEALSLGRAGSGEAWRGRPRSGGRGGGTRRLAWGLLRRYTSLSDCTAVLMLQNSM
ncbi:unnamed protein product [Lota lota]